MLGGGGWRCCGGAGVAAGLGNAGSVGKLAVPASWIGGGAPPAAPHAPLLVSSVSAAPEAAGAGNGNLVGGMPLAGTGRQAAPGPASGPRYGFKPTVMSRPPFAG